MKKSKKIEKIKTKQKCENATKNKEIVLGERPLLSLPGEPPLGVVSGENVTLRSSVIVLHREAIPTMVSTGMQ